MSADDLSKKRTSDNGQQINLNMKTSNKFSRITIYMERLSARRCYNTHSAIRRMKTVNKSELLARVSDKNVDINGLADLVIKDPGLKEELVNQLLTNPQIMVYYHCYYILNKAS